MQSIPALGGHRIALQLAKAGDTPQASSDLPIGFQHTRGLDRFAQDGATGHQLHLLRQGSRRTQPVESAQNALLRVGRHDRMDIIFIHGGDVIEHILAGIDHASYALLHNHRQLVGEARVVGNTIGNGRGDQVA